MSHVRVGAEVLHQRRQNDVDGRFVGVFASVAHAHEQAQFLILTNFEDVLSGRITSHMQQCACEKWRPTKTTIARQHELHHCCGQ